MPTKPQPVIDAEGVPWCASTCPHFIRGDMYHRFDRCAITKRAVVDGMHSTCLPAVRQMAARIRELEEQLRPKTVEELLDECRKWQLTDEELEQLQ